MLGRGSKPRMQREKKGTCLPHAQNSGVGGGAGLLGQAGWSSEALATLRHLESLCDDQGSKGPVAGEKDKCSEHLRVKGPAHGHQHTSSRDAFHCKTRSNASLEKSQIRGKS